MWKGRFSQPTADLVLRYSESISYDWRLYAHDIRGSIAHARAQVRTGLLTGEEFAQIETGLHEIEAEIAAGTFVFQPSLEDIHMNIEAELTRRIGSAGAKLHTARSRNDQVATDIRLYCRAEIDLMAGLIVEMQAALLGCAERHAGTVLPGYTHLQRGQPVLWGHHLLAYVEMLGRDGERLADCRKRLNQSPLGSGALAGSTINLDRAGIAQELGFEGVTRNSMDAVSDRDFIAELLFGLALLGVHLSRLSEDVILWTTAEFSFVTLSDAHTTGSSLMPQKKNPDVAELTRGKTGRLIGNLMSILTTLKGLPMTYNRDLQEDKEPLFDSIDTIKLALQVNAEMFQALKVNETKTRAATGDPLLLATDLADYLVLKGLPFRQAHEVIGKITACSVKSGVAFPDIPLETFREHSELFGEDLYAVLSLDTALTARTNVGAPSPENVRREIEEWRKRLAPR